MAALGVFFVLGLVLCVLLNLLVIIVLLTKGRKINYMGILMISLAVSDFLQAGIGYTVELQSYYRRKPIGTVACQVSAFSVTFLGLVSIGHLAGIAIERHIILHYPIKTRLWLENRLISLYVIIPSWLYGFIWALFPLTGWNRYTQQPGMPHSCGIDLTSKSTNYTSYTYNLLFWCFLLPICVIAYCSFSIVVSLKLRRRKSVVLNMGDCVVETRRKMERQQAISSLVMIGTFLFAWSPYAACVLVLTIRGSLPKHLLLVAAVFAKTSTFYNPIIYSIFVDEFRMQCKKLFGCRSETPVTGSEPNMNGMWHVDGGITDAERTPSGAAEHATIEEGAVSPSVRRSSTVLTKVMVLRNLSLESTLSD